MIDLVRFFNDVLIINTKPQPKSHIRVGVFLYLKNMPTARDIGINTNIALIKKMAIEDNRPDLANDKDFLHKAATWSYYKYGFGRASYYGYLENIERKRNNRLYDIDIKLWKSITKKVFIRDNYTCAYCGGIGGILECDHIHPISKGGTNDLSNLTTSCRKCNRQKKDKTVAEFTEWRKRKGIL